MQFYHAQIGGVEIICGAADDAAGSSASKGARPGWPGYLLKAAAVAAGRALAGRRRRGWLGRLGRNNRFGIAGG